MDIKFASLVQQLQLFSRTWNIASWWSCIGEGLKYTGLPYLVSPVTAVIVFSSFLVTAPLNANSTTTTDTQLLSALG